MGQAPATTCASSGRVSRPPHANEIEHFKDETPWEKSAMPPGARKAQRRSGYPRGARHEVQSLAMLEGRVEALTKSLEKLDSARRSQGLEHFSELQHRLGSGHLERTTN
jgi:hypothetical protein